MPPKKTWEGVIAGKVATQYTPNDLKKGDVVQLESGVTAIIRDNRKGQIRSAFVRASEIGLFDEEGSIYATDIHAVNVNEAYDKTPDGDRWLKVTQPEYYQKSAEFRKGMGF